MIAEAQRVGGMGRIEEATGSCKIAQVAIPCLARARNQFN